MQTTALPKGFGCLNNAMLVGSRKKTYRPVKSRLKHILYITVCLLQLQRIAETFIEGLLVLTEAKASGPKCKFLFLPILIVE